jgi:hypothetical protein
MHFEFEFKYECMQGVPPYVQANKQTLKHTILHLWFYFYVGLFILIPRLINYVCVLLCKVLKSSKFIGFLN